jgi:phosphotransferase system enzyme I (PtsP)
VAREATRAARITDVPLITERAMEMSELCDALRAILSHEEAPAVPKGVVWVGETVTVFELLLAARSHPAALVGRGKVRSI